MSAPYSYDLRIRVMEQYNQGVRPTTLCKTFLISRDTFYQWKRRQEATGDVKAIVCYPKGRPCKIEDLAAFKVLVDQQKDQRLSSIAAVWSSPISEATISRTLKKIGYTHKKRLMLTKNARKH
jgi:transposase